MVQRLRRELQQERKCRDDERRTEEAARERREEEEHRQGEQKLSQVKSELTLVAEKNATLKEEVGIQCSYLLNCSHLVTTQPRTLVYFITTNKK